MRSIFAFSGLLYGENGTIEGSQFWDFGTKNGARKGGKHGNNLPLSYSIDDFLSVPDNSPDSPGSKPVLPIQTPAPYVSLGKRHTPDFLGITVNLLNAYHVTVNECGPTKKAVISLTGLIRSCILTGWTELFYA